MPDGSATVVWALATVHHWAGFTDVEVDERPAGRRSELVVQATREARLP